MEARAFIHQDGRVETSGVAGRVPWWSFTKTVLAVALLRLWEQDKIDLDRNVSGERFTPAQLLRHEAGLPDYGALAAYQADVAAGRPPWTTQALLRAADADRLRYEPGQGWAYSNIGYWYVARLIEQTTGMPLDEALADLVLTPAQLSTARVAVTPADLSDVNMGDVRDYHPGWVYHGLVVGTAVDAARLLRQLLDGALLRTKTLSRMLECRPLPQFASDSNPDPAYGLGLMMRATDTLEHPIGHTGGGPGSGIAVYGQGGTVCVVWAASSSGIDPEAEAVRSLAAARGGWS